MSITLVPDIPENPQEVYEEMFPYFIEQLAWEMLESWKEIDSLLNNEKEFKEMILITFLLEYFLFFPKDIGWHIAEIQEKADQVLYKNRARINPKDPRNHKHYEGFRHYVHSDLEKVKRTILERFQDTDWQDLNASLI